jgi:hypothetical protein
LLQLNQPGPFDEGSGLDEAAGSLLAFVGFELGFLLGQFCPLLLQAAHAFGKRGAGHGGNLRLSPFAKPDSSLPATRPRFNP